MSNTPQQLRAVCGHDSRSVDGCLHCESADEIERLQAERERLIADGWRQCAKGQKTTQYCGQLEAAVAAERERWAADARLAAYVRERADERADGWRIDVWIIGAPSLETIDDVLRA